mmetsp:Transcript_95090/g.255790  ORF Transcript_95090/g.255790 Transcript_95090/m.255790 type:complete len:718 (-) Transcript_95090:90-2243(-)
MKWTAAALVGLLTGHAAATQTPVEKVVGLLKEMNAQVQKDAKADEDAYDKYNCWCTTNRGLKTEAVETAEKRIVQLEAFLEEAVGTEAQLKTEISTLEEDIAADQEALRTATALSEQESEEFRAAEADSKESVGAMREAVDILAKVQLLQKQRGHAAVREVRPMLMQVRSALEGIHNKAGFQDVMRRDLWDVMSSIGDSAGIDQEAPAFRGGRRLAALERQGSLSVADPSGLEGAAAGASSYSTRSGGIFGMLSEMKDEFIKNLVMSQKQEMEALISFQGLRAAKTGEIESASMSKEQKEAALADIQSKAAQAKEDLQATKAALGFDQQFILGLEKNCKTNDDDYIGRQKIRNEELVAISEAITILTEDDARDLFSKTMSFVQTAATTDAARSKALDKAMRHIVQVARKHHNWVLASLGVRMGLDAFEKVKEALDKMTEELKAQQKAEVEKKDYCHSNIIDTEDDITVKKNEKEDLEGKKLGLENSIESLKADLETLSKEVSDMHIALKRAGEDRKAENLVFQQSIADQRGTINVLGKAIDRLNQFYAESLAQVKVGQKQPASNEPGAAVAPPPQKPDEFKKSGGGGGVIQMLEKIRQDAHADEAELLATEQNSQKAYEEIVQDSNEALTADEAAIVDKSKLMEEATAEKSEADASMLVNEQELSTLDETLSSYHLDCDFVVKYFDTRQQARTEELEAIAQAKAILSGAKFEEFLQN